MKHTALRVAHEEHTAKPAMEILSFIGILLLAVAAACLLYLIPVELLVIYMTVGFVVTALYWIWRN